MRNSRQETVSLHLCKSGSELWLSRELELVGANPFRDGPGWVLCKDPEGGFARNWDACFATASLAAPININTSAVNAQCDALANYFFDEFRDVRIESPWPLSFSAAGNEEGLPARARAVRQAWLKKMRPKMARVLKLAEEPDHLNTEWQDGLFALFTSFENLFAARRMRFWGQRSVPDDPLAPSRSYHKAEEAYGILGEAPGKDELVVDLGAAPGGWSFSAAKRGATVWAVDNGPLKNGAANNSRIKHVMENAFTFRLPPGRIADWLFCDMIEHPYRVIDLVREWLHARLCLRFLVNLKVGKHDPVMLLPKLRDRYCGLAKDCRLLKIRQLHHDREEITLMGVARR